MSNSVLIVLFISLCFVFSCKKETKSNQGTIEFDIDSVHYSFEPERATIQYSNNVDANVVGFSKWHGEFSMVITIYDSSNLDSNHLRPIAYPGSECDCYPYIMYRDAYGCEYESVGDTTNIVKLQVVSCEGDPPILNATFKARFADGRGDTTCWHPKEISNGRIINVVYTPIP